MSTVSLHSFTKQHNIPKSSAYDRCKALGISTSHGLDDAAQQTLLREFGKEVPPQTTVEPGNHSCSLTLQVGTTAANLEQFRTDRIRQQLANPREFMAGLTGFLDQIEAGMDTAEQQQEAELAQLRLLKRQSQRRIHAFRRRADEYRIKTDVLTHIQNAELDELAALADEVNALGKPDATADDGRS